MDSHDVKELIAENAKLKEQLEELKSKESRYQSMFETSADALSILELESGKFIDCNQAAIEMHGVESEENFLNLTPDQISPEFQPCGGSSFEMAMERINKTFSEGPQIFKWTHSKLDGSTFPCIVSLTAMPQGDKNYVLAIGRDLTDYEQLQDRLANSERGAEHLKELLTERTAMLELEQRKFQEFVNLAPVGIAINRFDDGSFDYINKEFARFTGYSVDELNQMDYWDLTPKEYEQDEVKQLEDMNTTGRYGPYTKEYIHKDGHRYPVLLSGVKINDIDGHDYIWSVVQDITEQKRTEQALHDAKEAALKSSRAKDRFLSNMSHEIRTPMNGIYGTLQLLNQIKQEPESQELIDKAILSSQSLLTIINDILDFSKIEAGKLSLEVTEFNLVALTESVISDFYPEALAKGISLKCDLEDDFPEFWNGDPVRIKQILDNLTSNAVKFTHEGEVALSIKSSKTSDQQSDIVISIRDTGIGLSEEALDKLFKRFEQADKSTTRKYGGTGLGMSIILSLVELMNGKIDVTSTLGEGTECVITLPLSMSENTSKLGQELDHISCPELTGKTILIAEDNQVNLLIISKMLMPTGATVVKANNGKEAIELSEKQAFDLIFMDIQMPILDGLSACKVIRKSGVIVPIIAFTANVLTQEVEEYLAKGFNGYLGKPVEMESLYKILNDQLTQN